MTDRAVSSVLDVTVCLLLISASALTLTHATTTPDRDGKNRADTTLEILTTSTAWVEYEPTPTSDSNRTAHGTLANLVAAGVASNDSRHDESAASQPDGYRPAVVRAVRKVAIRIDVRMQVIARSPPSSEPSARGRFVVGPSPPQSADVRAASTTVPWGPTETAQSGSIGEIRLTVRTWSP